MVSRKSRRSRAPFGSHGLCVIRLQVCLSATACCPAPRFPAGTPATDYVHRVRLVIVVLLVVLGALLAAWIVWPLPRTVDRSRSAHQRAHPWVGRQRTPVRAAASRSYKASAMALGCRYRPGLSLRRTATSCSLDSDPHGNLSGRVAGQGNRQQGDHGAAGSSVLAEPHLGTQRKFWCAVADGRRSRTTLVEWRLRSQGAPRGPQ